MLLRRLLVAVAVGGALVLGWVLARGLASPTIEEVPVIQLERGVPSPLAPPATPAPPPASTPPVDPPAATQPSRPPLNQPPPAVAPDDDDGDDVEDADDN